MRFKGLLAAAVVLAGLGGALYWSNKHQPKDGATPATPVTNIVKIEAADIQKVEWKRKDTPALVLEHDKNGDWTITAPVALRADAETANAAVNMLASLPSDKTVDEKPADLTQFGFQPPVAEITITKKDGKTVMVLVGDETPTGTETYIKTRDDARVFTITRYTKDLLDKKLADLRDKRLLVFEVDKIARLELLSKGQATEFGKNSRGDWSIIKPKPMRADGMQVDELVRKLREAKMDPAASEEDVKKAEVSFGAAAPVGVLKLTDASGTQTLDVRKNQADYYARSSVIAGVHKIAAELGADLGKTAGDFRNRKLFDFGFSDVTKLEIGETTKLKQFQKSGEKWISGGQEVDVVAVQALIDRLREAAAVKFVEQGFTTPSFEVSLAYGKNTEKVLFAAAGGKTFAKRDGDPATYELDGKTLEELQKAAADVKPAPPSKDAKKK